MTTYTTDEKLSFDEIAENLGPHRKRLLEVFDGADTDETIDSSELRKQSGVPKGSVKHHLETLARWGLIRETGERVHIPHGGSKARVWVLTDRGLTFVDECLDYVGRPGIAGELDELSARVEDLEAENEELKSFLAKLAVHVGLLDADETDHCFN
ncbi:helix-turn-helix domain-containing protein [Halegenticoccus tardaugens]|uniref:helix-turn-helix domain-containing protein n=1 Tax=Halegenticoccus tardaugens TaxID=2071624 RepID=UPI00100B480A|nr:helix-turn-helix domain-containing protein [Halegenticoccus tardaugens]